MNRDKTIEITSDDENSDGNVNPTVKRLSAVSDRTLQSDIDSEYMEPVNVYAEPSDGRKNNRLHNNTKSRTSGYATVCVAPRAPTLPDPNGIDIRRRRRVNGRRCRRVFSGFKLGKAWAVIENFVRKKNTAFLCASLVMGTFGCIAFLVAIGVAASGIGHSSNCNCPQPDVTKARAAAQTHSSQATNVNSSFLATLIGPPGLPGLPGPKGEKGEQGPQGHSGIPGIPGEKGEVGEQGKRGKRGAPGLTPLGIKGDQGDVGPPGPVGVRGLPGRKGQQGLMGLRGLPGVQAAKGAKGDSGAIGPRGYTGYPGARGAQGNPGIQGVKGQKGQKGDLGQKGQRGEAL